MPSFTGTNAGNLSSGEGATTLNELTDVNITGAINGQALVYDSSTEKWINSTGGGSGTVTSVAMDGGATGLTYSGSPITTSGTITLGGTLATAHGGLGGDFSGNTGFLKLSSGTASTTLTIDASSEIGGILPLSNGGTGATSASDARTNLELGTMATQDADAVAITGGTITGVSGVGAPSVGDANQVNVSDGSGGWDAASLYYGTGANGQLGVGSGSQNLFSSYGLVVYRTGTDPIAKFTTQGATGLVAFESSTTSNQNVAIKSNSNRMTLVSNGNDYRLPTADGDN